MEKLHKPRTVHRTVAATVALPAMAAPAARSSPRVRGKPRTAAPGPQPLRPQLRPAQVRPRQWQPPAAGRADPPTAEPAGTAPERPGPAPGCPRMRPSARPAAPQPPRRNARPARRCPASRCATIGTAPARNARTPRSTAPEQPGLDLISRRPPQKFANFEDYLAAHGGMTVPLPPGHRTQRTFETVKPAEGCRMTPPPRRPCAAPYAAGAAAGRAQPALCQSPQQPCQRGLRLLTADAEEARRRPGDGKAMVRARRAFLSAGHYAR